MYNLGSVLFCLDVTRVFRSSVRQQAGVRSKSWNTPAYTWHLPLLIYTVFVCTTPELRTWTYIRVCVLMYDANFSISCFETRNLCSEKRSWSEHTWAPGWYLLLRIMYEYEYTKRSGKSYIRYEYMHNTVVCAVTVLVLVACPLSLSQAPVWKNNTDTYHQRIITKIHGKTYLVPGDTYVLTLFFFVWYVFAPFLTPNSFKGEICILES